MHEVCTPCSFFGCPWFIFGLDRLGFFLIHMTTFCRRAALVDIITDNRPFLIYLNRLMDHDELPTWKDATRLVAALAAFHRPNYSDVSAFS